MKIAIPAILIFALFLNTSTAVEDKHVSITLMDGWQHSAEGQGFSVLNPPRPFPDSLIENFLGLSEEQADLDPEFELKRIGKDSADKLDFVMRYLWTDVSETVEEFYDDGKINHRDSSLYGYMLKTCPSCIKGMNDYAPRFRFEFNVAGADRYKISLNSISAYTLAVEKHLGGSSNAKPKFTRVLQIPYPSGIGTFDLEDYAPKIVDGPIYRFDLQMMSEQYIDEKINGSGVYRFHDTVLWKRFLVNLCFHFSYSIDGEEHLHDVYTNPFIITI